MSMTIEARNIFKETGKTPIEIYVEHQEMLKMLRAFRLTQEDNLILKNLVNKIER